MRFGLPLRTTKTTTESVTKPLYGPFFQFLATRPLSTSEVTSGSSERATMSARQAVLHGAALLTGRSVGLIEREPAPGGGLHERRHDRLVRLLRRGVGDQAQLAARRGGRRGQGERRPDGGGEQHEGHGDPPRVT